MNNRELTLIKHDTLRDCYEIAYGIGYERETIATGLTSKHATLISDALRDSERVASLVAQLEEARELLEQAAPALTALVSAQSEPEREKAGDEGLFVWQTIRNFLSK